MTSSAPSSRTCKIVAVDGPAGSGKSSVCSEVCRQLGWTYVNTGFLYRSIALIARQRNQGLEDNEALRGIINEFCEALQWDPTTQAVGFHGQNLTPQLYTDQAGKDASSIAKNPLVRELLLPLQRRLTLQSPVGAIVDGRDIGTVVFPDADLKIFMTASLEVRALRRMGQLQEGQKPDPAELEAIKTSILQRDQQDAKRGTAPLIQAPDAIVFDTSDLDIKGSIAAMIQLIRTHIPS
jgi:cytidylate kinase